MGNLAFTLLQFRETEAAIELLTHPLAGQQRVLGDQHPATVATAVFLNFSSPIRGAACRLQDSRHAGFAHRLSGHFDAKAIADRHVHPAAPVALGGGEGAVS